jgi:hypothetical protein
VLSITPLLAVRPLFFAHNILHVLYLFPPSQYNLTKEMGESSEKYVGLLVAFLKI